jgi:hypothetical protein
MKRLFITIFLFSLVLTPATHFLKAVSLWDVLEENQSIKYILIEGTGPNIPTNPFNDSSIMKVKVIYSYNQTHDILVEYTKNRTTKRMIPTKNISPFRISDWDLDAFLKKYNKHIKIYDNASIKKWTLEITNFDIGVTVFMDDGIYSEFDCYGPENLSCYSQFHSPRKYTPKDTTTSTTKEKLCGSGLLVGLALIPILARRWRR